MVVKETADRDGVAGDVSTHGEKLGERLLLSKAVPDRLLMQYYGFYSTLAGQ